MTDVDIMCARQNVGYILRMSIRSAEGLGVWANLSVSAEAMHDQSLWGRMERRMMDLCVERAARDLEWDLPMDQLRIHRTGYPIPLNVTLGAYSAEEQS